MSPAHDPNTTAQETTAQPASTYADERWQGPSFAASWISPPHPRRFADDPGAPMRGDDHA
jgi:hypothetical protein